MSKPKGACTHEPIVRHEDARTTRIVLSTGDGFAFPKDAPWVCAKCKRWLKAKWYPTTEAKP